MQRRRFLASVGAFGVALPIAGCVGDDEDEAYDVGMTATEFVPREITIAAGESVVWRNTSSRAHTVSAYENAIPEEAAYFATGGYDDEATAREEFWASHGGAMENGEEYEHTFEVPGTYDYVCIPHEEGGMLGTVRVE